MTVTSVSSLAFMLFLVGVTLLLLINLNHITEKVENNVEIQVYLKDTNTAELKTLWNNIESIEKVSSIDFVSKNEGLQSFMKNLGDEGAAFQTLKDDNPLNDKLVVKTEQPQDVSLVASKIENLAQVDKVEYAKNVVAPLLMSTKIARLIGGIFIICLTLISGHLVSNTLKITVLARKQEIQLRKLIGATNYFIRYPFIVEGSFIGLLGALFAVILTGIGYYFVYIYFNKYVDLAFVELIHPYQLLPISCLLLLGFGAFIGIWGANSSLRRILKI